MADAWGHKLTYVVYQPGPYLDEGHGFDAAQKLSEALPDNVFVGMTVDTVYDEPTAQGEVRSIKGLTNIGRKHGGNC